MTTRCITIKLALLPLALSGALAFATSPPKPALALSAQAKVTRAAAEKTALTQVPGGRIAEGELEREHGHLVWSFDITQTTTKNVTEVQVDAVNGKVVSVAIETPADQAKEAQADAAKSRHK